MWRLISIVLPAENTPKAWLTRGGYLVSAIVYSRAGVDGGVVRHVTGARRGRAESEDAKVERFTRELMEKTGGRWLVGAIGVVLVGVGRLLRGQGAAGQVPRRARARRRRPVQPRGDRHARPGRLGRAGHRHGPRRMVRRPAPRSSSGPDEAKGFDGALRERPDRRSGALLVGFAAVALVVYGLFCVISAPRQRLTGAD